MRGTRTTSIIFCVLMLMGSGARSQDLSQLGALSDSLFDVGIQKGMIPGGAIAAVSVDDVLFAKGYGYADVERQHKVDAERTLFQIGSVGKLITAISILKLVERGQLDLDSDVSAFLPGFPLDLSFTSAITLRHLLTHTAGFDDRVIGYAAKTLMAISPLEEHLRARMPARFQEAGRSISYSNYGYALAGLIVEKVSGRPFTAFVQENVLEPLRMHRSTYVLPEGESDLSDYAKGYRINSGAFAAQPIFFTHAKPAGGISSTAVDMANLMKMLLNEGTLPGQQILRKESLKLMLERQFSNHRYLSGYTMGFEEQSFGGTPAVAKGGQTLGFVSALVLLPQSKIGVFITTNVNNDDFVALFMDHFKRLIETGDSRKEPELMSTIAATPASGVVTDAKLLAGTYRDNRYNHHTIEDFVALFRGAFQVQATESGGLSSFHSGQNHVYEPLSPQIFRNSRDQDDYLIFEKNDSGQIVAMYRNTSFAGLSVPLSYESVAWYSRPHFVNEFLSFLLMLLILPILVALFRLALFLIRLKKKFWQRPLLPLASHLAILSFGILAGVYMFGYVAQVNRLGTALVFGVPEALLPLSYLPYLLILLFMAISYYSFRIWFKKSGTPLGRLCYTGYFVSALTLLIFLSGWQFIGINI